MTGEKMLDSVVPASGQFAGLAVNPGTFWATVAAGVIVIAAGLFVRSRITSGNPGRLQLALETMVESADRRVARATGRTGGAAVPLALSLFFFILVANMLRAIPGTSALIPSPTADLNLTAALALIVAVVVHTAAVRARGWRGYLRHYVEPYWWLLPVNVIEEFVRPLTLSLRLFATAFTGGLVLVLVGELIPQPVAPLPHVVWSLFDLAIGVMQAAIFALLALFYYESAVGSPAVASNAYMKGEPQWLSSN